MLFKFKTPLASTTKPVLSDREVSFRAVESVLLLYQKEYLKLASESSVLICEKSRRIGISWVDALMAVLRGAKGVNTYYSSFSQDAALQYVKDAKSWIEFIQKYSQLIGKEIKIAPASGLLSYTIHFQSGAALIATSSAENTPRGKKGDIVRDEAAYGCDLPEFMRAAVPATFWGGRVRLISTHNGEDSGFNQLVNQVKSGEVPYTLFRKTFREAIADGVYRRMCQIKGEDWNQEKELAWVESCYADPNIDPIQELDVIPRVNRDYDKIFNPAFFTFVSPDAVPNSQDLFQMRGWDLAATDAKKATKHHFYTAGVKLALHSYTGTMYILEARAKQLAPLEGDKFIIDTALEDGIRSISAIEHEPGSTAIKWERYIESEFLKANRLCQFIPPIGDKLTRAIPVAADMKSGRICVVDTPTNRMFIETIRAFDGGKVPLVTDYVDALSCAYHTMKQFDVGGLLGT